jgi:putative PIN family toxin of toxin-antitoxin system
MESKLVIIDTNLWISYLMSSKYNFLDSLIKTGRIKLIFSEDLLDEFLDVTNRPKFLKYFEKFEIDKLFKIINKYAIFIDVRSDVILSRDNNDDFLLNLALDSNADYLVSGDSDLLVLDKIGNTQIITINKLKENLLIIN